MPYLICEKCGGYYELQEGESLEGFETCQCGGKLKYIENIDGYVQRNVFFKNKNGFFNILNNQNKYFKATLGVISIFIIVLLILGITWQSNIDTTTYEGYHSYIGVKNKEFANVVEDLNDIIDKSSKREILDSNAITRLNNDEMEINRIIIDLNSIKIPPEYENNRILMISGLSDFSAALNKAKRFFQTHDISYLADTNNLLDSAEYKLQKADNELKTI